MAHWVPNHPNLLVPRTQFKAHSLAGFRVGYGVFPKADEAAHWGTDLVVMRMHGRRGFQHLMLGSLAEPTLRRPSVLVLLIPPAKETTTA